MENGADVNDVDFLGHSVLMAACHERHKDTVVFLLDNGADVNFLANVVGKTCYFKSGFLH